MESGLATVTARIAIPSDELAAFCERWGIVKLALFGSVLRDDFGPNSDIDVLAGFDEVARHTLFDMDRMEEELENIFGRGVERNPNYLRRNTILQSAELVYGS